MCFMCSDRPARLIICHRTWRHVRYANKRGILKNGYERFCGHDKKKRGSSLCEMVPLHGTKETGGPQRLRTPAHRLRHCFFKCGSLPCRLTYFMFGPEIREHSAAPSGFFRRVPWAFFPLALGEVLSSAKVREWFVK